MPRRIKELVVISNSSCLNNGDKRIWALSPFSISWTMWLFRNDVVFQNASWDNKQVWNLIHLQTATWANANWPSQHGSILDMYIHPSCPTTQTNGPKTRVAILKFNVDGAANDSTRDADIGGILRSENGVVQARFSKKYWHWGLKSCRTSCNSRSFHYLCLLSLGWKFLTCH
ncbi:Uncharacterized protein TCM_043005 [Theobroma cacao]|uniref:RNase H type-1 domain-containing protein n=1 Tax=Theobroma cacao TaxID=3641 RepID=A0A061FNC7_THECC|nr:Uncharacterized protein TCM_043005 [Theobroma cacao]